MIEYNAVNFRKLAGERDACDSDCSEGASLSASLLVAVDEAERLRELVAPRAVEDATIEHINELLVELGIRYVDKSEPDYQGNTFLCFKIIARENVKQWEISDIGDQAINRRGDLMPKTAADLRAAHAAYMEKQRASGVVLSPAPSKRFPGVRLARALELARKLFADPSRAAT